VNAQAEEVENEVASAPAKAKKAKAEVEVVVMSDGRKVEFPGRKRLIKDYTLSADGSFAYATLDFRNGETRKITVVDSLVGQFVGHGVIQKYGDELAGIKGVDGSEADIDDMVLTIDELDERLQKGEWSTQREGGSGMGGTSILIRALMEYGGQTVENVKAFLADKDQAFKIALRNNDKRKNKGGVTLKAIVSRLESEKAAKASKVDTDQALAGLDAMEAA
jgi:hypothetical protein